VLIVVAGAALVAATSGCLRFSNGGLACGPGNSCPPGYECGSGRCWNKALTIRSDGGAISDMAGSAGAGVDLAVADLAGADLAGADLAGVDLGAVPDLARRGPPDMTCVPATENCFNGVDDDCDGLVDCADTQDCPATVATCVPDTFDAHFAYGTMPASSTAACPSNEAAQQLYNNFDNSQTECNCPLDTGTFADLSVKIYSDNPGASCSNPNHSQSYVGTATAACTPVTLQGEFSLPTCVNKCTITGPPVPPFASMGKAQFCAAPSVGGGCKAGSVCAPAVGTNPLCVIADAQNGCPAAYPKSTSWWTSFADQRSCAGACRPPDVSCGIQFYSSSACQNPAIATGYTPTDYCTPPAAIGAVWAQVYFYGCHATANMFGSLVGAGSQKIVCCE
jgi:hypothetical protein